MEVVKLLPTSFIELTNAATIDSLGNENQWNRGGGGGGGGDNLSQGVNIDDNAALFTFLFS